MLMRMRIFLHDCSNQMENICTFRPCSSFYLKQNKISSSGMRLRSVILSACCRWCGCCRRRITFNISVYLQVLGTLEIWSDSSHVCAKAMSLSLLSLWNETNPSYVLLVKKTGGKKWREKSNMSACVLWLVCRQTSVRSRETDQIICN